MAGFGSAGPLAADTGLRLHRRPGDYRLRVTARLEAEKSTQADVTARLGRPNIVTYGDKGHETWNYYFVVEYPLGPDFIPLVNSLVPGFRQYTRRLAITFDRQGLAQNLQEQEIVGKAEKFPY